MTRRRASTAEYDDADAAAEGEGPPLDALRPPVGDGGRTACRSSSRARATTSGTRRARSTSTASPACSSSTPATAARASPRSRPSRPRSSRSSRSGRTRIPTAIELADRLADYAPGDLNRVFFSTGGGEAVETAFKLAKYYWKLQGRPTKHKVISRAVAYHGTPQGALAITGIPAMKEMFEPVTPGGFRVPNTNYYRAARDGLRRRPTRQFGVWAANRIEEMILFEGPETVAAVFLEPVQNSRRLLPAAPRLLPAGARDLRPVRRAARLGRGDLRASAASATCSPATTYGYVPDMITCAKAHDRAATRRSARRSSATGSTSRSATATRRSTTATPSAGTRSRRRSRSRTSTSSRRRGSTSACARTRRSSAPTLEKLLDLPIVGDVRGDGYFFGIELVKDKATKETFDDDESERLLRGFLSKALFDAGLYCRADDRGDPVIQLAPPLTIGAAEFDEIERILRGVLTEAWTASDGGRPPGDRRRTRHLPRPRASGTTLVASGLDTLAARPALAADDPMSTSRIVGGGLTGLWTAWYLLASATPACASPCSRRRSPGSARRGATAAGAARCSRDPTASLERAHGRDAALAMRQAMVDTVDEVGRVARRRGHRLRLRARRHGRVRAHARAARRRAGPRWPRLRRYGVDRLECWERRDALRCDRLDGSARRDVRPGLRAHASGEARAGTRSGGRGAAASRSFEQTEVLDWARRAVRSRPDTRHGDRCGRPSIIATEGYGAQLPRARRRILPLYSLMIATEPLADDVWDEIGIEHGQTFTDYRHLLIYGQRTADNRFAFGGRGARYHWGSAIRPGVRAGRRGCSSTCDGALARPRSRRSAMRAITHRWGGPLGDPARLARHRELRPGDGRRLGGRLRRRRAVSTTNLAGRTLADLVTGTRHAS